MKTKSLLLIGMLALIGSNSVQGNPLVEGKEIFVSRCAACHNVNKDLTGPALAGLHERRSIDWILRFVRSSQTLIKTGDKDAVALFQRFNSVPMPDHLDLTDEQIKSIVEYVKSESKPVDAVKAPFAKPGKRPLGYKPLSFEKDYEFFIAWTVAVALLVMALLFAVHLNKYRRSKGEE